jgi:hypothetical protein
MHVDPIPFTIKVQPFPLIDRDSICKKEAIQAKEDVAIFKAINSATPVWTREQVRKKVYAIRMLNPHVAGVQAINDAIKEIVDGGWRLQISAYHEKVFRTKRGGKYLLKKPYNQWYIGAAWIRGKDKVWYYSQPVDSMKEAKRLAKANP